MNYFIYIFLFIKVYKLSHTLNINTHTIDNSLIEVLTENAVYQIIPLLNLTYRMQLIFELIPNITKLTNLIFSYNKKNSNKNIRIIRNNSNLNNEIYIESASNQTCRIIEDENNKLVFVHKNSKKDRQKFIIYKDKDDLFYIKNVKNNLFLEAIPINKIENELIYYGNFTKLNTKNKNQKFLIKKVYREALNYYNENKESKIFDKIKVDVIIKYIDLRDPNLHRKLFNHTYKDYDNFELKYALRSILNNIPWINKIYIIMPNEKVRFLKPYDDIKEKIVYIKDKDMLGFDSASSTTFELNLWRMKKFNVSNYIIYMNDDYFINKPLKKSDFFYVENGKILPLVLYNVTNLIIKEDITKSKKFKRLLKRENELKYKQSGKSFTLQVYRANLLLFQILKNTKFLSEVVFYHNAISINLDILEEVYYMIYNLYDNKEELNSILRTTTQPQFQTFFNNYILNKYDIRIKQLNTVYIELSNVSSKIELIKNSDLFCINTVDRIIYNELNFKSAKKVLDVIFPNITKFEQDDEYFYKLIFIFFVCVLLINICLYLYKKISRLIEKINNKNKIAYIN